MKRSSLLARFALLLFLSAVPCFISQSSLTAPFGEVVEGNSEKEIERWIKDLGSDSFVEREAAMHALMDLEEEPPSLRKELKSPDLEVRRRVAKILEAHVPKRAKRGLAKIKILAKEGRVDEMAERLVLWKNYDTGEGWKALVELAANLAERADRINGKTHFRRRFQSVKKNASEEFINPKNLAEYWQAVLEPVRDDKITFDVGRGPQGQKMIIASGNIDNARSTDGIIVSGGNLQLREATLSVVVCAGDCEIKASIMDSLIIARGKITCPQQACCDHSIILGEDFIEMPGILRTSWSIISNDYPNGFVKFFNPADVGITAWNYIGKKGIIIPNGARIIEVREGTPFASRLQPEDAITAIDETKTPTFDVFRKVLRRKLAEGSPIITFTVRRADKTLEVPVPIRD